MREISIEKKYELYIDTLNLCGLFLLKSSDEDIEHNIFEEFDTDCISFLHKDTLKPLLEVKLIDKRIFDMSLELASKFRALESSELWNVESVKTNKKWLEILIISDTIKKLIEDRN